MAGTKFLYQMMVAVTGRWSDSARSQDIIRKLPNRSNRNMFNHFIPVTYQVKGIDQGHPGLLDAQTPHNWLSVNILLSEHGSVAGAADGSSDR
jgi:hypothetical protein